MPHISELADWLRNKQAQEEEDTMSGDKFVLGNTMKSTYGKVLQSPGEPINFLFSKDAIDARLTEEQVLELQGFALQVEIFAEAIEEVKHLSAEQLWERYQNIDLRKLKFYPGIEKLLGVLIGGKLDLEAKATVEKIRSIPLPDDDEPPIQGDTSMGLNAQWINWYMAKHQCQVWQAVKEGKAILRKLKLVPKRKKRTVNPK